MRVAVISDIHGNLHALEAVLAAIERERPDALWCLGDLVGYGPRPNRCCALVAESATLCLVGNHDLGVLGRVDLDEFSHEAAAAARWTALILEREARAYLESLEPAATIEQAALYHGSPLDPVWDYVLTAEGAVAALEAAPRPLVLVGHSHVPLALALTTGHAPLERAGQGPPLQGGAVPGGTEIELAPDRRWLLNPGSVGQPRDGDPRAAWLLLDLDARRAFFRRLPYAVEQTQRELLERGLPPALAERLAHGV